MERATKKAIRRFAIAGVALFLGLVFVPLLTIFYLGCGLIDVMRNKRLQFDAGNKDISASFLSIRPELTAKGRQLTYVASRTGETGHADVAWAIMHVLFDEPLDGEAKKQSVVEFC